MWGCGHKIRRAGNPGNLKQQEGPCPGLQREGSAAHPWISDFWPP